MLMPFKIKKTDRDDKNHLNMLTEKGILWNTMFKQGNFFLYSIIIVILLLIYYSADLFKGIMS
ncbi:hypothetical protein SAMN05421820_10267 [Pedobacter steynii]|uniref:Uncharacterized protein n=1 Tax=Pedobacter steynii TaxID=430522 RepID=A0A1G9MPU8_9SPHI|nr:hypothetical protein SAMN05421820_10267 [Pedobacter steynii]